MMTLKYNGHPIHAQTDANGALCFYTEDVYTVAGKPVPDGSPVSLDEVELKKILGFGITNLIAAAVSEHLLGFIGELYQEDNRGIVKYIEVVDLLQRTAHLALIELTRDEGVTECPE